MPDRTVGDLMHKGVISCRPETPMSEVVWMVADTDLHAIVVIDRDNQPLGIISHADIIRLYGEDLSQHVAEEVMSRQVIAVESGEPARAAVAVLLQQAVHCLLVVEVDEGHRRPVGMLSPSDLVKDMRGARWTWRIG